MDYIYRLIKLNRIIKSYRLKFLLILLCDLFGIRHLFLRFDPINACNLRCGMCYFSGEGYSKKVKGRFNESDIHRVAELFFPKALQLVIGCASEPTLYKKYADIVDLAKEYKVPYVGFTTNAQLLTKDSIRRIVDSGLDEITVSVHGVTEESYEKFMVNASFKKLIEVLDLLKRAKDERRSNTPHLRINYTVNEENLDELTQFFDVYENYDIHTLQLRPMADLGKTAYAYSALGSSERAKYDSILKTLAKECQSRGVSLLATKDDPNYLKKNKGTSYALPAVLRMIHPNKVWMSEFNWRTETYRQFCQKIGWRRILFKSIFLKREYFEQSNRFLTYEVTM